MPFAMMMNQHRLQRITPSFPLLAGLVLTSGLFSACGGGSAAPLQLENADVLTPHPDGAIGSQFFLGQTHFSGDASELRILNVAWGRMASVADAGGTIRMRNFLVSDAIRNGSTFQPSTGASLSYTLTRNPVTDQFLVTIPADVGTTRFEEALTFLQENMTPVFDKSLEPNESGPFSMVPRNATVVIEFNDLLEPVYNNGGWSDAHGGAVVDSVSGQLSGDVIKLGTGYPPVSPHEARVLVDPNHGNLLDRDGDGVGEFYSTRVLICPTISAIDAQASNPPLGINSIGLPASLVTDDTNLALRIPTLVNAALGQSFVLRSAGGKAVSFSGNGSTNNDTGTLDVVRALRSGGHLTGDPHNGFLRDEIAPVLIADISVTLLGTPVVDDPLVPNRFTLPGLGFDAAACSSALRAGDVLEQAGVSALIVDPGTPVLGQNVVVDVLAPVGGSLSPGAARLQTPLQENNGGSACFLRFSPAPGLAPASLVQPNAAISIRFSEPMDPGSIKAFDQFSVHRSDGSGGADQTGFGYAIGRVVPDSDLRTFRWDHSEVPFHHTSGLGEVYFVNVPAGAAGPTDLAGNSLAFGLPEVPFTLDPSAQQGLNSGFALRFDNIADNLFDDFLPELRSGQLLFDPVNSRILPRPVNRFSSAADTNQPLPSVMTPFVGGLQTPLSNLGSKLQTLWRYVDVGFSLTDETNYNVDVEGLSWAPTGGFVTADAFDEFSVSLAHSHYLPDEFLNPNTGFPAFPGSGLKQGFDGNHNDPLLDPGSIVHERSHGYVVNPSNLYTSTSGRTMLPFPVNQGKAPEDRSYYTWRDTALTALGGPAGGGAMLQQEILIMGGGPAIYTANNVPTVGLPLLMEFRCYPADEALGLNAFDVALAANSSARPNFRAFSTGGFDGNQLVYVDPDNSEVAVGGWNPNTNTATPGTDNTFYLGELALVTRVSRIHTIWFDTAEGSTTYAQPMMEPAADEQPAGTSVTLAFRGATNVSDPALLADAGVIDPYGNETTGTVTFLGGDESWKADMTEINSARYFQVRISFISNAATDRTAELRTLAFAYHKG